MILQGRAGTGKSFVIRCLQKLLKDKVRVGAFTAKAAYMIDGQTLHSLFKLNIDKENKTKLGPIRLSELKERLDGVKYFILDEYSMIGCNTLEAINMRLK